MTDTAAASVGVAKPPYIEPMTPRISSSSGPRSFNATILSQSDVGGGGVPTSDGFSVERTAR